MKKSIQKGFTLIELVVVIVILGILAATALPKFIDMTGQAEQAAAEGAAGSIASASSINYAAIKVGNASAITVNAANVCTGVILGGLLQGGLDAKFSISGTGDCTALTAAESVSCTVSNGVGGSATASVICAR